MKKQAFSSEKYLNLQRDHIIERINQFDGKLYLESVSYTHLKRFSTSWSRKALPIK